MNNNTCDGGDDDDADDDGVDDDDDVHCSSPSYEPCGVPSHPFSSAKRRP